jgi:hypothetical protein
MSRKIQDYSSKAVVLAMMLSLMLPGIGAWWNASWAYRMPITITENSGNSLTDYQVLVTINTASLIAAGKMRSDCGDIRFADDGTSLSYWLESGCNTTTTLIWVKVSSIPANSTVAIYLYYGNASATSASNGDNTFEFFDDASTNKSSSYTFVNVFNAGNTGSLAYDGTNRYYTITHTQTDEEFLRINSLGIRTNLWLRGQFWIQTNGGGSNNQFGFIERQTASNTYYRTRQLDDFNRIEFCKEVSGVYTLLVSGPNSPALQTWYTLEGSIFGYKGTTTIYNSSGTMLNGIAAIDGGSSIASGNFGVQMAYDSGTVIRFRNVIVRKYTSPEPTVTLGVEQLTKLSKKNVPNLNQSVSPLANTHIAQATDLMTQANNLLAQAQTKNLDTGACEKLINEANELLTKAKASRTNPIYANNLALQTLEKLKQSIDCLKALLG